MGERERAISEGFKKHTMHYPITNLVRKFKDWVGGWGDGLAPRDDSPSYSSSGSSGDLGGIISEKREMFTEPNEEDVSYEFREFINNNKDLNYMDNGTLKRIYYDVFGEEGGSRQDMIRDLEQFKKDLSG